jgi:hypothetical protein
VKKKLLLPFFLLSCLSMAHAQTTPSKSSLQKHPEKETTTQNNQDQPTVLSGTREQRAKKQIAEMKDGVLLVRLRTQENAIRQLQKIDKRQADALKHAQLKENKQLAEAFLKNFTFCPVYFFYSTDSDKLINGETTGILLNEKLEKDPAIILGEKPVFVAEITNIEQFRPEQFSTQPSSDAEISFRALVVRDGKLNQLASPFPYYVKIQQLMPPRKRTETELVRKLNEDLVQFYKLVTGKSK